MVEIDMDEPKRTPAEIGALIAAEELIIGRFLDAETRKTNSEANQLALELAVLPGIDWQKQINYLLPDAPDVRRNRQQAIRLFPLFVGEMLLGHDNFPGWSKIATAIDMGKPLIKCVATQLKCRPVAVRCLRGLTENEIGATWRGRLRSLLSILSNLAPERFPKTRDQWQIISESGPYLAQAIVKPIASVTSKRTLADIVAGLLQQDGSEQSDLAQRAHSIEMLITDLGEALIAYLQGHDDHHYCDCSHIRRIVVDAITKLELIHIESWALDWQAAKERSDSPESMSYLDGTPFLSLPETPFEIDNLRIVQLTTLSAIHEESRQLEHCVGNYGLPCIYDNWLVFSVQNPDGSSSSTVAISIEENADVETSIRLLQHKGHKSCEPCLTDNLAVESFLNHLSSPLFRQEIEGFCSLRRKVRSDFAAVQEHQETTPRLTLLTDAAPMQFKLDELLAKAIALKGRCCAPIRLARGMNRTPDDRAINPNIFQAGQLTKGTGKKPRYRWLSALSQLWLGDFLFLPLTTTKDLVFEGRAMRNCVARYDEPCAKGIYRVFSIRDLDEKRLATLGLTFGAFGWKLDQCFGKRNINVITGTALDFCDDVGFYEVEENNDLYYAAQEVARLFAKADYSTGSRLT